MTVYEIFVGRKSFRPNLSKNLMCQSSLAVTLMRFIEERKFWSGLVWLIQSTYPESYEPTGWFLAEADREGDDFGNNHTPSSQHRD